MSLLPVPVQDDTEVRAIAKQATDLRHLAAECVVDSLRQVEWATAILGDLAKVQRVAEERRLWFVRPLNEHVKAINELFKSLVAPLAEADRTLRQKVLTYRHAEQQRIAAEVARLQAERDAKEAAARMAITTVGTSLADGREALRAADTAAEALATVPPPPAPTVKTAFGSTTARRIMDFEVTDPVQIPTEYLQVNAEAVRAAIRRGVRTIPGMRIFEREVLAVKAHS